jgi:PAS domain S-box-containing protein
MMHKDEKKIIFLFALGGVFLWVVDALFDTVFFSEGPFLNSLLFEVSFHELYFRSLFLAAFIVFGILVSRMMARRRAEDEKLQMAYASLAEEKARTEAVLGAIGDGISIQSTDFRVLYQNQAHKTMVGEHLGEYCFQAYSKLDEVCPGCPVTLSFQDGQSHSQEKNLTGSEDRSIEITASPLKDSSGQMIAGIELVRDITDRKRAEILLRESEKTLHTIADTAKDAIIMIDDEGKIVFWNPAAGQIFGHPSHEALGRELHLLIAPPSYHDAYQKGFNHYQQTGEGCVLGRTVELQALRRNGTEFPVEISLSTIQIKGRWFSTGIIRDITSRKQAEEKVKLFSGAIEEAMDGVQIIDLHGYILYSNKAVEELYGYSQVELVGKHVNTMNVDPDFASSVIVPCIRTAGRWSGEIMVQHKNGSEFPVWLSTAMIKNDQDEPIAMIGITRDVTERKRVEDELRDHRERLLDLVDDRTIELTAANARLKLEIAEREKVEGDLLRAQKLESLGILAGGIAHDFNNLLASVMGNVSLAKLDIPHTDRAHRYLAEAEQASLRARDLTQQLLTFSKGGTPVKTVASLAELIRESAGFALRGSRVRHALQLPDELWLIEADEAQMTQVINNLLINADQAMPEGGVISVSCENVTLNAHEIPPLEAGKYVLVKIADRGTGIPKEHLDKVFDPYFTTKQRGSGLGLAVTYSIINNHGGHISLESTLGKGTTFRLYLPATEKKLLPARAEAETITTGQGRVLVMDDEETIRTTMRDILVRLGYEVAFAEDGAEAIELYTNAMGKRGTPYDAVIMDLTIAGGMGGREAVKKLIEIDPNVKAIVSSGYSKDPVMAEYKQYGFRGVIAKPFRIKDLSEVVHRVINGPAS